VLDKVEILQNKTCHKTTLKTPYKLFFAVDPFTGKQKTMKETEKQKLRSRIEKNNQTNLMKENKK
ncbi:hypothetical protein THOM_2559, partial [Trachipleistophora hominis]